LEPAVNVYTLSPASRRDLTDAALYAAKRAGDFAAGERVLDTLTVVMEKLASFPTMGRSRVDLRARMRSFPASPFLVYYRRTRNGIHVIRILHEREDVQKAFPKRSAR
jgi:toxin ParE1/3/4